MRTGRTTASLAPHRCRGLWLAIMIAFLLCACSDSSAPDGERSTTPVPNPVPASKPVPPAAAAETDPAPAIPGTAATDTGTAEMQARFEAFDAYQQALKKRFNDLAFHLRRLRLERDVAVQVNRAMSRAGYLLKLPKGIAAFDSIEAIDAEQSRLAEATVLLDEVTRLTGTTAP